VSDDNVPLLDDRNAHKTSDGISRQMESTTPSMSTYTFFIEKDFDSTLSNFIYIITIDYLLLDHIKILIKKNNLITVKYN